MVNAVVKLNLEPDHLLVLMDHVTGSVAIKGVIQTVTVVLDESVQPLACAKTAKDKAGGAQFP